MKMKVEVSAIFPCSLQDAVAQVMTSRLLIHIAKPLVCFSSADAKELPAEWKPGEHWVCLSMFGLIPFGRQCIVISFPAFEKGFAMRDSGYSSLIKVWNHLITIESHNNGVFYRDHVEIRAGIFTPIVWIFAQVFYRHPSVAG